MRSARNLQCPTSWAAIMLGCQCIGHIVSRGPMGLEAFDPDDKSLGLFGSQAEAADALGRLMLNDCSSIA
jgi:hypothetical protein